MQKEVTCWVFILINYCGCKAKSQKNEEQSGSPQRFNFIKNNLIALKWTFVNLHWIVDWFDYFFSVSCLVVKWIKIVDTNQQRLALSLMTKFCLKVPYRLNERWADLRVNERWAGNPIFRANRVQICSGKTGSGFIIDNPTEPETIKKSIETGGYRKMVYPLISILKYALYNQNCCNAK